MREVLYKKKKSLRYHRKRVSINERTEDKQCKTHVRKSFIYILTKADVAKAIERPTIYIKKAFDTQKREEKFLFRVKGAFYMTRRQSAMKVDFCHTLQIDILWKNKIFSPKKSVTLT